MVEKPGVEAVVRDIKRRTHRKYSSEEKIRIVLERLRGEMSIWELCRKEVLPVGRHREIFTRREQIRRKTLKARRRYNLAAPPTRQTAHQLVKSFIGSHRNVSGTL